MCKSTFLNLENSRQILTKKPLTVRHYFASTPTPHSAVKRLSFIQKHSDTTVCYYHVMYEFQRNLHSIVCLNVKEPLAGSRRHMWSLSDSNGIRTHNYVVRKRTLNHLVKLAKWLSCVVSAYLYGAFDCMFLTFHVRVSEWIHRVRDVIRMNIWVLPFSIKSKDIYPFILCYH